MVSATGAASPANQGDGKESGGAKNEWFVNWEIDGGNDFTKCKSAIEAINWINKM
jgi:hypothetical protein